MSGFLGENCLYGYHEWTFLVLIFGNNIHMLNDSSIFNILTLQRRNLDMQDLFMPTYSLPTKSYPVLKGKSSFYATTAHINQNGSANLNWVISHQ